MAAVNYWYNSVGAIDCLTCPICLRMFTSPKILPCLHTFCLACLRRYQSNIACYYYNYAANSSHRHGKPATLPCPVCREPVRLGSAGVAGLRNDFRIESFREALYGVWLTERQRATSSTTSLLGTAASMSFDQFGSVEGISRWDVMASAAGRRYNGGPDGWTSTSSLSKLTMPAKARQLHRRELRLAKLERLYDTELSDDNVVCGLFCAFQ